MSPAPDPHATLGVSASASDEELRTAYRRLVQRHHPDHNGGSAESARRFTEIQEAYAQVRVMRAGAHAAAAGTAGPDSDGADEHFDARLAEMERELRKAREQRDTVIRRAREAARSRVPHNEPDRPSDGDRPADADRPSDEELGYVTTDDSFSKIIDDFADQVSSRVSEAQASPRTKRVADWIDELGSRLTGEPPDRS